ncbi:MAG: hypothetical protein ABGW91_14685 [Christiangramia sp.]|uniref:Uncharacterized protein n=1 Tax=Christiangramia flava JLT2011 TaxID=1229726 RepID=A0A1L7I9T3_9FLAO|nr:hypothetical protein [Christiangramia flava]APU69953.1 hypothetical protein GRFL_3229 [Christiangramia flava JLT2011]OSS39438.1 hypothetical protein C723_1340 [Christiangramia flava JLT2011]
MTTLSNIIRDFGFGREANLTHRRSFMNSKTDSSRDCWYNRRHYG